MAGIPLLAKLKDIKIKKPGKGKAIKSSALSNATGSILKSAIKNASSVKFKVTKTSGASAKSALALIKKLKKNKGLK